MKKFKQLMVNIVEATGAASKAAALRFTRSLKPAPVKSGTTVVKDVPLSGGGKRPQIFPEDPSMPGSGKPYDLQTHTDRKAAISYGKGRRAEVKAAAEAEGKARGEAKAKQAAEMAARIATATKEATKGSGVKKQIDTLEPGQTIAVDLQDGGFGYVHHAEPRFSGEKSVKYFSKGNNQQAHPIHGVRIQPDHLEITTPRKKGKNVDIAVVGKVNHKDATPIKSGGVDRNGRFVTQHDINR